MAPASVRIGLLGASASTATFTLPALRCIGRFALYRYSCSAVEGQCATTLVHVWDPPRGGGRVARWAMRPLGLVVTVRLQRNVELCLARGHLDGGFLALLLSTRPGPRFMSGLVGRQGALRRSRFQCSSLATGASVKRGARVLRMLPPGQVNVVAEGQSRHLPPRGPRAQTTRERTPQTHVARRDRDPVRWRFR